VMDLSLFLYFLLVVLRVTVFKSRLYSVKRMGSLIHSWKSLSRYLIDVDRFYATLQSDAGVVDGQGN
jgi:hypothetical protein